MCEYNLLAFNPEQCKKVTHVPITKKKVKSSFCYWVLFMESQYLSSSVAAVQCFTGKSKSPRQMLRHSQQGRIFNWCISLFATNI